MKNHYVAAQIRNKRNKKQEVISILQLKGKKILITRLFLDLFKQT